MDLKTLFDTASYASPLVLIMGMSVGVYYYKNLDKISKLLMFFLGLSLLIDLLSRVLDEFNGNNLIAYFALSLLELIIFLKLYHNLTKKKKLIWGFGIIGILSILIEFIYVSTTDISGFQVYSKSLIPLLIVIMALIYFFELIKNEENLYKAETSFFSLNSMILCFFSLQFLIFLPINFLTNIDMHLATYIFLGNVFFLISFYSYLTYFIWMHGRNLKQ